MIKLIVVIKRRAGMTPAAFHDHWRTIHAEKVRACPASARYIRRYVQAHVPLSAYEEGTPAFDGTAELWFDSTADMDAFYRDPAYLAQVEPDEPVFADMEATRFIVTQEETIL